jgi:hypothetical protein
MNKKAAIGLSMNVLVVIIISLVILGGGITLLYKFIGGAEDLHTQLKEQTDQELERLLVDKGKKVALPMNFKSLYRGDNHVFGVGILNIDQQAYGNQFRIEVELSSFYNELNEDNTDSVNVNLEQWLLYNKKPLSISENDHDKEYVYINVPKEALRGKYIFNVRIFSEDSQYGNTQKVNIDVIG